ETAPTEARYLGPGGTWRDRQAKDSVYRVEVLDAASSAIERMCGSGAVDGEHTPLALSATAIGPQSSDRACRQLVLCFAGRPGAKAAFDDRGRNTAAACWS
ncbi:MAG TPA: hypothetical protein VJM11_16780, partial [Nevskiaceae bacterium]|nr:hypothetical protein [Nevskiaceae bacterium]